MTRYPTGDFLNETQWRKLNHDMGCTLVQRNYGAANCAGPSRRSWIHRHIRTTIARLCVEKTRSLSRILLRFTLPVGHMISARLITFLLGISRRVHQTRKAPSRMSGEGWQGTYIKVERSARLWVLSAKLCSHYYALFCSRITNIF